MTTTTLNAKDICTMLGVIQKTLNRLVTGGKLKATVTGSGRNRAYAITVHDFGHFLCCDPHYRRKFLDRYSSLRAVGDDNILKFTPILRYLESHRLLYSVPDVARLCYVEECTAYVWVRNGILKRDVDDFYISERSLGEQLEKEKIMHRYMPENYTKEMLRTIYLRTFYI